ncbi:hypothetical protein K435DRAFT_846623 [Dendrothele bispora CBS 962.96]|uniref:Uncharacterized protein n=1 Tax=Dendrothele bispora (strain CBS 962.96) TaxID=1314807 RepID=A0A4S8KLK6_DENBC|nr:hypothetical protein K435DRAFT_846623 [Dendrothele bispora CBS 962.96]
MSLPAKQNGDSANAEIAARGRASEYIRMDRHVFGSLPRGDYSLTASNANIKMSTCISEAMISKEKLISSGDFGFVVVNDRIMLARVTNIYSENGGKTSTHSWVASADSIGSLSYISCQVYECGAFNHHALKNLQFLLALIPMTWMLTVDVMSAPGLEKLKCRITSKALEITSISFTLIDTLGCTVGNCLTESGFISSATRLAPWPHNPLPTITTWKVVEKTITVCLIYNFVFIFAPVSMLRGRKGNAAHAAWARDST